MGILVYRLKLLFLFFPFIFANIYSQKIEIKSLKVFTDKETSLPVLLSNNLNIEFDIKSDYEPNLVIVFRFCDRNWNPIRIFFFELWKKY